MGPDAALTQKPQQQQAPPSREGGSWRVQNFPGAGEVSRNGFGASSVVTPPFGADDTMSDCMSLDNLRHLAMEVARENGEMEDDLLELKEAVTVRRLLDALYDLGRRTGSADAMPE